MTMQLIISPIWERQQQRLEQLKRDFLRLYTERDRMLNEEADDLYIRYLKLVGKDKYENFRLSVEVRALKLQVELAQAAINRNCRPDADDIKRQVDEQLQDYYETVRQQAQEIKEARRAKQVSKHVVDELRQLYHMLVKRLHPDLHPGQSEKEQDLFLQGQAAYRMHDLTKLRETVLRLDIEQHPASPESAEQMTARLSVQVEDLRKEIEQLRDTFPFNLRDQLNDPQWVKQQQAQLKREREQLEEQKRFWADRFALMTE